MKKTIIITLGVISLLITACNTLKQAKEKTLYVSAQTKACAGATEKQCLQVKWTKNQEEWTNFYGTIENFKYELGYEYELIVKVENTSLDKLKYTLVKEINKKQVASATSQGLKKPYTSSHVFTAKFEGITFHRCMGRTALCPEECGQSGNMASFKVINYQDLVVNGEAGREKLEHYQVLISNFHKIDIDKSYVSDIKNLQNGDEVTIYLEYVYDTTLPTVQTVENIVRITKN